MNPHSLSKIILSLVAALSVAAVFLTMRLDFDYDFEKFFPQNDPETEFYKDFRHQFETDNDFLIVGLTNQAGIFDSLFLSRADKLSDKLAAVRHIEEVFSPTRMKEISRDPLFGFMTEKMLLRKDDTSSYAADSSFIFNHPDLVGTFFSPDGKSLLILLRHKQYLAKAPCDTLSFTVQDIVNRAGFDGAHVVGRSIGQTYYVNMMQTELIFFVGLSIILIVVFLFLAFRTLWGIWVPLVVVLLSVLWLLGIMALTGKEIDLMLTVLPTILFVVGMSDIVHLLARYFDELRLGHDKITAIRNAWREVGLATFLTSLTTAIGFLTLMSSPIMPIRDFGLYTAIGVFVAYVLAYTVMPSILVLNRSAPSAARITAEPFWNVRLHRMFGWIMRHQGLVLSVSGAALLFGMAGASQLRVNNYLLEDLRPGDPLRTEFEFFADNFSGGRPFELAIQINDSVSYVFNLELLRAVDSLDNYLADTYGVGSVMSTARIVRNANRVMRGGSMDYYSLPETQAEVDRILKLMRKNGGEEILRLYANSEKKLMRISGKTGDLGSIEINFRNEALQDFFKKNLSDAPFHIRVTGTAALIDQNNAYLASNMVWGLVIAFGIIALIIGILFRSLPMVIVSLIPNILPLLMVAGLMGFLGIDLKVSTSIIFTIAFGIAVDDTIHFMSKLRLLLAQGRQPLYALKRTFISTGKAIIVTSIILCGGFVTLIGSEFNGTFYIGLLISLTLLFAVIADLVLLPVLLLWTFKRKPSARIESK